MVPSVPGFVMWWRGQAAIGPTGSPIWLSFQVSSVTGGTVFAVDLLTQLNLPRISGIGLNPLRLATNTTKESRYGHRGSSSGNTDDDDRRLH